MVEMSRERVRELAKKVNKTPKLLKELLESAATQGYDKGVSVGVDATKDAVLKVTHNVLKKEWQFGPKRLEQFNNAFRDELFKVQDEKVVTDPTQQIILSNDDKQRLYVIMAFEQFIETTMESNTIFKESRIKEQLYSILAELGRVTTIVKEETAESTYEELLKELEDQCLYIGPKAL